MSAETTLTTTCPEHAALLGALDRLFTIGTYYPAGHSLVVEVAEGFGRELQRALAGATTLAIDVGRTGLFIAGQPIEASMRGASRLHDLLDRFGVARLEFDASVTPQDLHGFVTTMQRHKLEADTVQGFHQFDLGDLGGAIRVVQREFGQRIGGARAALRSDQVKAAVDSVLKALERADLDANSRAACERLVERLFARIAERMELDAPMNLENRPAFGRSLEEVFALGTHAIRHALLKTLPATTAPEDLMRVFENAERALALSDDTDTVELMLDVFREATHEVCGQKSAVESVHHTRESETCEWSVEALRRRITEAERAGSGTDTLIPPDRSENISTLLLVVSTDPPPPVLAEAVRLLLENATPPLKPAERSVLVAALSDLASRASHDLIDTLFGAVLDGLRADRRVLMGALLQDICHAVDAQGLIALWPHVVNEILLGIETDAPATAETLHGIAAALEAEPLRRALPRLERLAALRDGRVSTRWLHAPPPDLLPLCAQLLNSSQGLTIGAALWEGLRKRPPAWLPGQDLRLLGDYQPRHRPLLSRLLGDMPAGSPTAATRALLSRLLVEALAALPAARRSEAEVADAIASLGRLGEASAGALLRTIQRQRRFCVLPAWPARCRQAAGEALRLLRGRAEDAPQRGDAP